jgi:hypothetical protein
MTTQCARWIAPTATATAGLTMNDALKRFCIEVVCNAVAMSIVLLIMHACGKI